jgi:hypothetical protein
MQIVDFASLQAAVADWLNRTDLTARIPDFIGLAEVRMMRKLRMRLLEADKALVGVPGSRFIPLPSDYREPLNFWWNNGADRESMRFVPPELLDVYVGASRPFNWSVDGTNIAFERPCDQAYSFTFRYRQKLALSVASPTNVLLTQYPDVYLFASLVEAAPYMKDKDALAMWDERYGKAVHDIREEEEAQKGLTTLSTEPALLTFHRGRGGYNVYTDR